MSLSAHIRRGLGLTAAAGLAVAGLQVSVAAPASAAAASINQVSYTCTAEHFAVDAAMGGPREFLVNARTTLPDTVASGDTIPQTRAELDLVMPAPLVDRVRDDMEVDRVAGTASSTVFIQGVAVGGEVVGELQPQVVGLESDWTTLPNSGSHTIPAAGTVEAITVPDLPDGNGLIYVQMPKRFVLDALLDPPVLGTVGTPSVPAVLNCVRNSDEPADRIIGTIAVGEGCTQIECPLGEEPDDGGNGGNGGGGDNGGNGGGGSDEEPPYDPYNPEDPNNPEGADYSNDGDGGSGGDSSDVASYTTTALPATGSPLGLGLIAVLAAAVVGRVALGIRNRRRSKA
ncbi:hypothetical protein CLV56_2541 [Mumia flava]|uniref:DUF6801 domain-containing protein n=1 Tax=Mumia flava TaxID=1348852 RepID=A0A0B2BMT3_9ACTN|nr:DUF6801 domain-containing protein [Mumia flava]PJJ58290.1 hypothetical protein CLV56_2541 [Mumia flava]